MYLICFNNFTIIIQTVRPTTLNTSQTNSQCTLISIPTPLSLFANNPNFEISHLCSLSHSLNWCKLEPKVFDGPFSQTSYFPISHEKTLQPATYLHCWPETPGAFLDLLQPLARVDCCKLGFYLMVSPSIFLREVKTGRGELLLYLTLSFRVVIVSYHSIGRRGRIFSVVARYPRVLIMEVRLIFGFKD